MDDPHFTIYECNKKMLLHFNVLSVMIMRFYLPFPGTFSLSEMLLERAAQQSPGEAAKQQEQALSGCLVLDPPLLQSSSALPLLVYLFSRMQQNLLKVQRGVRAGNDQLRLSSAASCGSWDASLAPPAQGTSPRLPLAAPTAFPFPRRSFSLSRPILEPQNLGLLFQ